MADYTILIVDYEPRSIESARTSLVSAGFKVEVATDGVAGLDAFGRLRPDLVLIEAMLPKKHGFEVCQTIKKTAHGKQTPVLITTSVYKGRKYRSQALHIYGCDEYVEKPIAGDRLVELCRRLLNGGTAAPEPAGEVMTPATPLETLRALAPTTPPVGPRSSSAAAIVGDLTEEEIIARLDAILPDDGMSFASWPSTTAVPEEPPAQEADQLGEPDAESGLTGALEAFVESTRAEVAADPEPITAVAQPFTEPPPAEEVPEAASGSAGTSAESQVVSFDATRRRKRRKRGKGQFPSTSEAAVASPPMNMGGQPEATPAEPPKEETPAPAVAVALGAAVEPMVGEESRTSATSAVPEPELFLTEVTPKAKTPLWVWVAVVGVVATGALYLLLGTDGGGVLPPPPKITQPSRATVPTTQIPLKSSEAVAAPENPPAPVPIHSTAKPDTPSKSPATRPADAAAARPVATRAQVVPPLPPKQTPPPQPAPNAAAATAQPPVGPVEHVATPPQPTPSALVSETPENPSTGTPAPGPAATPRKTVSRGDLVTLDDVDSAPVAVKRPTPAYSARARMLERRGSVFLNVLVDETGKVADVQVIQGIPGSGLTDAAEKAARTWVYKPAIKDGVPVKVWTFEKIFFGP
jgi:TonB family protein